MVEARRTVLLPEPKSKFDKRAIVMVIDGNKAGHVPKADRDQFRSVAQRGQYGVTHSIVKSDESNSPHAVSMKYAREGILSWNRGQESPRHP